jgi:hypothetical protein
MMPVLDKDGTPLQWPRHVPWSDSALERFERCSLMYGKTNYSGVYPFQSSPAMEAGNVAHKSMEEYITMGKEPLPILKPVKTFIDKLIPKAREVIPERSINLTYDLRACPWSDPDVSYRGKLDFTAIMPDQTAVIVDYKTSSEPREDFEQLEYQALALLLERPKLRRCYGYYAYSKFPRRQMEPVNREDVPRLVKLMVPRLKRLEQARAEEKWIPTPGFYCKWCPVATCKFNPKRN